MVSLPSTFFEVIAAILPALTGSHCFRREPEPHEWRPDGPGG